MNHPLRPTRRQQQALSRGGVPSACLSGDEAWLPLKPAGEPVVLKTVGRHGRYEIQITLYRRHRTLRYVVR